MADKAFIYKILFFDFHRIDSASQINNFVSNCQHNEQMFDNLISVLEVYTVSL